MNSLWSFINIPTYVDLEHVIYQKILDEVYIFFSMSRLMNDFTVVTGRILLNEKMIPIES